jgi:hypothetical protein
LFFGLPGPIFLYISSYAKTFGGWWICIIGAYAVVNGLTYIAPVHHCWAWMPDKPGLVSGIILAAVGLSSLFVNNIALGKFDPLLTRIELLNPQHIAAVNGQYPESVYSRVPDTLRKLSYIYASLILIAVCLVHSAPKKENPEVLPEV